MERKNFVVGLTEISKSKELRLTGEAHGFSAHTVQWPVSLFSRGCIQSVHLNLILHFANSTIWHSVYKKEWRSKQYLTAFTSNQEGTGSCILLCCVGLPKLWGNQVSVLRSMFAIQPKREYQSAVVWELRIPSCQLSLPIRTILYSTFLLSLLGIFLQIYLNFSSKILIKGCDFRIERSPL